ncbi:MAG: ankyrin repeat domain-containing protein [bacterium]
MSPTQTTEVLKLILKTANEELNPEEFETFFSQTNKRGNNALMEAANDGNQEALELILETAKAKLNREEFKTFFSQTNKHGDNPLMVAAKSGNEKTVELILNTAIEKLSPSQFKTFLTQTNEDGDNALTSAVSNNEEAVGLILKSAIKKLNPYELNNFFQQNVLQKNRSTPEVIESIMGTANKELNPQELKTLLKNRRPEYIALEFIKEACVNGTIGALSILLPIALSVAVNSISKNPTEVIPDLLPNFPEQVNQKKNLKVPEPPKMPILSD